MNKILLTIEDTGTVKTWHPGRQTPFQFTESDEGLMDRNPNQTRKLNEMDTDQITPRGQAGVSKCFRNEPAADITCLIAGLPAPECNFW
jgi:hypothetical protein